MATISVTLIALGIVLVVWMGYFLLTSFRKDSGNTDQRISTVQQEKSSVKMSRFAARRQVKSSVERTDLNNQLTAEAVSVQNLGAVKETIKRQEKEAIAMHESTIAMHEGMTASQINVKSANEAATKANRSAAVHEQLQLAEGLSQIKTSEHKRMQENEAWRKLRDQLNRNIAIRDYNQMLNKEFKDLRREGFRLIDEYEEVQDNGNLSEWNKRKKLEMIAHDMEICEGRLKNVGNRLLEVSDGIKREGIGDDDSLNGRLAADTGTTSDDPVSAPAPWEGGTESNDSGGGEDSHPHNRYDKGGQIPPSRVPNPA